MFDLEPAVVSVRHIHSKLKISCISPDTSIQFYCFNFYKSVTFFHYKQPRMKNARDWYLTDWFVCTTGPQVLERVVESPLITY
jgi:hypothetical protein